MIMAKRTIISERCLQAPKQVRAPGSGVAFEVLDVLVALR
jgi:hypothetical protein